MRTNGPATGRAHHLIDIGAGEADIGQHAVIEGDQAGEGATLFRTPEKGGEKGHFINPKEGENVRLAVRWRAYAAQKMNLS